MTEKAVFLCIITVISKHLDPPCQHTMLPVLDFQHERWTFPYEAAVCLESVLAQLRSPLEF